MQHIQKALGNCAVSTVQPASFVALSDHNGAIAAASATAIPHSVNFVSGILLRDRRQPGHQNAAPGCAAADKQPPQSSGS